MSDSEQCSNRLQLYVLNFTFGLDKVADFGGIALCSKELSSYVLFKLLLIM